MKKSEALKGVDADLSSKKQVTVSSAIVELDNVKFNVVKAIEETK